MKWWHSSLCLYLVWFSLFFLNSTSDHFGLHFVYMLTSTSCAHNLSEDWRNKKSQMSKPIQQLSILAGFFQLLLIKEVHFYKGPGIETPALRLEVDLLHHLRPSEVDTKGWAGAAAYSFSHSDDKLLGATGLWSIITRVITNSLQVRRTDWKWKWTHCCVWYKAK